jgi:tetratricopeptide (TPR) repeat protein
LLLDILISEADLFERTQEFNLMFDSLHNILLQAPNNTEALERIWLCTELSGRYEDSILLHQKILEIDSYSFQAWYNLGQAFYSEERYEEAANAFEYAYLINDDFEFAYRDRGEALLILGKYAEALKCYQDVKERFVPDADLYSKTGQCFAFLGQHELAIEHYATSLQMGNKEGDIHFHIGASLCYLEKYNSSKESFLKAIDINPDREEFYLALADVYYQCDEIELAIIQYQKAVDISPDHYIGWLQYASFLLLVYGEESAMEVIEEAFFYCDSPELHYLKVVCLISGGKRQDAILSLMQLMEECPEKAPYLFEVMPELKEDLEVKAILAGM